MLFEIFKSLKRAYEPSESCLLKAIVLLCDILNPQAGLRAFRPVALCALWYCPLHFNPSSGLTSLPTLSSRDVSGWEHNISIPQAGLRAFRLMRQESSGHPPNHFNPSSGLTSLPT